MAHQNLMVVLPSCHVDRLFMALMISYNILINGDILSYNLNGNPFRQCDPTLYGTQALTTC